MTSTTGSGRSDSTVVGKEPARAAVRLRLGRLGLGAAPSDKPVESGVEEPTALVPSGTVEGNSASDPKTSASLGSVARTFRLRLSGKEAEQERADWERGAQPSTAPSTHGVAGDGCIAPLSGNALALEGDGMGVLAEDETPAGPDDSGSTAPNAGHRKVECKSREDIAERRGGAAGPLAVHSGPGAGGSGVGGGGWSDPIVRLLEPTPPMRGSGTGDGDEEEGDAEALTEAHSGAPMGMAQVFMAPGPPISLKCTTEEGVETEEVNHDKVAPAASAGAPGGCVSTRPAGGVVTAEAAALAAKRRAVEAGDHVRSVATAGGQEEVPPAESSHGASRGPCAMPRAAGWRHETGSQSVWDVASTTPTPCMLSGSCSTTPAKAARFHSKVKVPLPAAPTTVDFSSVRDTVGKFYKIGCKIGEGTYGEVYLGEHLLTKKKVALKRLKLLQGLEGFPLTSLREIIALQHIARQQNKIRAAHYAHLRGGEAAPRSTTAAAAAGGWKPTAEVAADAGNGSPDASLRLAEIVGLDDVLLSDSHKDIYLVFDYVPCSLAGLLQANFPFTEYEVAYIFRSLFRAASKLHAMKIIHRDIKADNVLIGLEGSVHLCDFGLCVFEGSGRNVMTPSLINLSYRPPEMLLGSVEYDEKVDIWSLGCFLAQMFLRRPPFLRHVPQGPDAEAAKANGPQMRQTRGLETELNQLRLITEVLGPIHTAGPGAFPESVCRHLPRLQQLRATLGSSVTSSSFCSFFTPSLVFEQFHGFSQWFCAVLETRRRGSTERSGWPVSRECLEVLDAIFQLDPRKRPSADQILQFPFFTTFIGAPPPPAAQVHGSARSFLSSPFNASRRAAVGALRSSSAPGPSSEEEVRRGLADKILHRTSSMGGRMAGCPLGGPGNTPAAPLQAVRHGGTT